MVLSENLNPLSILVNSESKTRWDIIKEMVAHAVRNSLIPAGTENDITQALIERESARRLALLGGSEPDLELPARRRSVAE